VRRLGAVAAAGGTGLLCVLLAGCSVASVSATHPPARSASAVAAAPPANACALVSEADATTALGTDPGPGTSTEGQHGASSCSFGQYPSLLIVNLIPTDGKASYDNLLGDPKTGPTTQVSGVGDAAFFVSKPGTAGFDFRRGDAFVAIVLVTGGASPVDQATVLASELASRL
jgi:hypothetical protein